MKRVWWMSLGLLMVGCGEETLDLNGDGQPDEPGSVTQIAPVHPEASVSGYVYDAVTGAALDGVSVSVHTGQSSSSASSAGGLVELKRLAAGGTALVLLSAEGYMAARLTLELPDSAGDFPSSSNHATFGQIGLLPAAPLTSTVFGDGLVGLEGVVISLNLPFTHIHNGQAKGGITLQSSSGAEGALRFEGAPALSKIGALTAEFGGNVIIHGHADDQGRGQTITQPYTKLTEMGRLPLFVRQHNTLLDTFTNWSGLRMVHANVADLVERRAAIEPMPVTQPIRLLFDRAVNPATLDLVLVDESGESGMTLQPEFSAGGRLIALSPALGTFAPGVEYNLRLYAEAADDAGAAWFGTANLLTASDHTAPFSDEDYQVEWDDHNEDGEINGGDDLFIDADLPVGRRQGNGQSGLSWALAQFAFVAPLDTEESVFGEIDYEINGSPSYPALHFEEPSPGSGIPASGYTTRLRLRLPSAASFNANMGISVRIKLIFDNPQLLQSSNQVRMPNGTALTNYIVRVELP